MPYFRTTSPPDPPSNVVVKTSRFSILHDSHPQQQSVSLSNPSGNEKANGHAKRTSKLPDIITVGLRRNRTTSLPQRPRSSDGRSGRITSATADPVEDSANSVASSSLASGTFVPTLFLFPAYPGGAYMELGDRGPPGRCALHLATAGEELYARRRGICPGAGAHCHHACPHCSSTSA